MMLFFAQFTFGLVSVFMYGASTVTSADISIVVVVLVSSWTGEHHSKHPSSTPIEAKITPRNLCVDSLESIHSMRKRKFEH